VNFEIAPKSTEIEANWDDARLYCFALIIDGKTGWRLPTIEELITIYQSKNDFQKDGCYWSSTECSNINYVLVQNMGNGRQDYGSKNASFYSVRAIRSTL
jgi:hypothetical protein